VVPTDAELVPFTAMMEDSLAEDRHSPVPGLVHRYPDRVLMLVTTQCASYLPLLYPLAHRRRPLSDLLARRVRDAARISPAHAPGARCAALRRDPLVLAPKILEEILRRLREIPHIEIVRIGSRVPVFLPMRVTDELCEMLQKISPAVVEHPR